MWWSLFGVLTLSVAIWFAIRSRIEARWKSSGFAWPLSMPYEQMLVTAQSGTLLFYRIGIRGAAGFDFQLKPERWWDKLFKLVGISGELQIGDRAFDRTWYVVSEDWLLRRALLASTRFRADLLHLLSECVRLDLRLKRLRCQSGRLWVDLKPNESKVQGGYSSLSQQRAAALVPLLYRIAQHVAHLRPERFKRVRDRYARRAWVLLSISTGLALYAGVHLVRLLFVHIPFLISPDYLLWHALLAGGAALGGLVLAALLLLGGTSRAHLVLFELLLTGSFGLVGTAYVTLRDVNMDFDEGKRQIDVASVADKRVQTGRRRAQSYYITLAEWPILNGRREIKAGAGLFYSVGRGDKVDIVQRSGYLGHAWVEAVVPQPRPK